MTSGLPDAGDATAAEAWRLDALMEELERLPSQPSIAMRVMAIADNPGSSARDLAAVIQVDIALTARVLRLANSAYYGLSGRVGSVAFAITVLGFPTVRALAAAAAAGLFHEGERVTPTGFWEHSLHVATGCSMLADRAGLRASDAFSLGLLHDLGSALLFRSNSVAFDQAVIVARRTGTPLSVVERDEFGMDHTQLAGRVFAAWGFPQNLVDAVASHHGPARLGQGAKDPDEASPTARLLSAAESIAARLPAAPRWELSGPRDEGLSGLGLTSVEAAALAQEINDVTTGLLVAFG